MVDEYSCPNLIFQMKLKLKNEAETKDEMNAVQETTGTSLTQQLPERPASPVLIERDKLRCKSCGIAPPKGGFSKLQKHCIQHTPFGHRSKYNGGTFSDRPNTFKGMDELVFKLFGTTKEQFDKSLKRQEFRTKPTGRPKNSKNLVSSIPLKKEPKVAAIREDDKICSLCKIRLPAKKTNDHIWRVHVAKSVLQCTKCSFFLKDPCRPEKLQSHFAGVHPGEVYSFKDNRIALAQEFRTYKDECFGNIVLKKNGRKGKSEIANNLFECGICGYQSNKTRAHAYSHLEDPAIPSRRWFRFCHICKATYRSHATIAGHLSKAHPEVKSWPMVEFCAIVDKCYGNSKHVDFANVNDNEQNPVPPAQNCDQTMKKSEDNELYQRVDCKTMVAAAEANESIVITGVVLDQFTNGRMKLIFDCARCGASVNNNCFVQHTWKHILNEFGLARYECKLPGCSVEKSDQKTLRLTCARTHLQVRLHFHMKRYHQEKVARDVTCVDNSQRFATEYKSMLALCFPHGDFVIRKVKEQKPVN